MCGLCGVLGQVGHWTDSEDSLSQRSVSATRSRERAYQLRIINRVLNRSGLRVNDWQSSAFIVSSNTGASEIVDHISMLKRDLIIRKLQKMKKLEKKAG